MTELGQAQQFTKEELASESEITESDILAAVALWRRYAPAQYNDLLTGSPKFVWDIQKRQYKLLNGKYIDPLMLRNRAIEPFLQNMKLVMRGVSQQLRDKSISLQEWQKQTTDLIKYSQIAAALAANGGVENTSPADYKTIAAFILALFVFHLIFATDIESGAQKLNGLLLTRTDLYATAGRDAYEEMRRYGMKIYTPVKYERRILKPGANHCTTVDDWDGCIELAAMGWQRLGVLPRLMDTPCRTNCLCTWDFK